MHHQLISLDESFYTRIEVLTFCVQDGYDSDLIQNFYGLPAFQHRFGKKFKGKYYISAPWQTAFAMSSPVGRVIGGGLQGPLAERFGRKKTLFGCLVLLTGFIFIQFFSTSNAVLMVGQMLCGTIWGILSSLAPVYASEVH